MSQDRKVVKDVINLFDKSMPPRRGPPSPQGIVGRPPLKGSPIYQPQLHLEPPSSIGTVEPTASPREIRSPRELSPPSFSSSPRITKKNALTTTALRIASSNSSAFDSAFDSGAEVEEDEKTDMLPAGTFILKETLSGPKNRFAKKKSASFSGSFNPMPDRQETKLKRLRRRLTWKGHGQELIVSEYEINRAREESFFSGGEEEQVKEISSIAAKLGKGQIKKAITLKFQNEPDPKYIRQATSKRLNKLKAQSVQGKTLHTLPDRTPEFRYLDPERFEEDTTAAALSR